MIARKIELLAPAKNLLCGIAAINHGADAVYIGGPLFGARAAASNNLADIEKLVTYAHQFRAKVYVALNTLLNDDELDQAVELSHQLYGLGADALIVQDFGLLASDLPPIPLHSSTQMNNRTVEKIQFLENVGFTQIVLARELSLAQIQKIRSATSVALEFFVHGALCVSYSGQCYISEVMAGRSANRGECAQFCRHQYTLQDNTGRVLEKDRYLLSLKDLDLSSHLEPLIDAGISSLKIEGRLKDEHYVKNVTAAYRLALDRIIDSRADLVRASSGRCQFGFTPDPSRSFSRGKTDYFLNKRRNVVGEIRTPKSIGKKLGRVAAVEARCFILEGEDAAHNGDGLCFFHPKNGLIGVRVNRVEGQKIYPKDGTAQLLLAVGTEIFRNADTHFSKLLGQSELCRKIVVHMTLQETADGLWLKIIDEDGIVSETTIIAAKERAEREGTLEPVANKQLRKSGGTVFSVADVSLTLSRELFFPAAVFNDLRRKAFATHLETRLTSCTPESKERIPNAYPWPVPEVGYLDNITNAKAAEFYRRHGVQHIDPTRLRAADVKGCALMTTKYCIKAQLGICPQSKGKIETFEEPLTLADKTGSYTLGFDCDQCEMTVTKKGTL
ncbi:U32 family peptidase [uncultured Desulfobulbus sp.]|uniref:peptidase U32 family protein n=1 Tax=uncultured Desulfobulbus sp. TaxID=239745 RepID=UPI0029C62401|nr:U32 family peptidase [uncultured Desulfobulbus sp.]